MSHERDDIIEYSLYNHHSEEEGKKIRRKIWLVTLILTVITGVEVMLGAFVKSGDTALWHTVMVLFVAFTILKSFYIVMTFMHLGNEIRKFRYLVVGTYAILMIYLVILCIIEGVAVGAAS